MYICHWLYNSVLQFNYSVKHHNNFMWTVSIFLHILCLSNMSDRQIKTIYFLIFFFLWRIKWKWSMKWMLARTLIDSEKEFGITNNCSRQSTWRKRWLDENMIILAIIIDIERQSARMLTAKKYVHSC